MITLFTDGSCRGNPGPGGWAAILANADGPGLAGLVSKAAGSGNTESGYVCDGVMGHVRVVTGHIPETTNNRMELTAVIEGLRAFKPSWHGDVQVVTDSKYVCDAFNKGWLSNWATNGWRNSKRRPIKNRDLWEQLYARVTWFDSVTFVHVTGHAGHRMNERAHELAAKAAGGN